MEGRSEGPALFIDQLEPEEKQMQGNSRDHRPALTGYEEVRHHFNWVLDLLMPEEGHALLLLGDHGDLDPAPRR